MEAARSPWPALGVLLVRDGLVSPEELEQVLAAKDGDERLSSRRLGELLVERGLVTTAQVARLVAEQHELPFVDLDDPDATVPLAGHLTEEVARELSALPIRRFPDGSLLVVVADPTPAWIYDEIHRAAGAPVRLAVAAPDGIVAAIDVASAEGRFREPNAPEPGPLVIAGVVEPPLSSDDAEPPAGSWPVLGSLLLRDGLVTKDELEGALAQQRLSSTRRLGEILVQRGALSERQLAQALAEQHELPFVDLAAREIDRIAAARLPLRLAREHCALPVDVLGDGSLLVAVADPTSTFQSTALRAALDVPFLLGVAVPEEIEAAIAALDDESPAPVEPISLFTGHPVEIVSAPEPDLEPVPEHEPEPVTEPEAPAVPDEIEAAITALDDEPPARVEPIAVSNEQPVEMSPEPDPETEAVHEEESVPELEALPEEELEPEVEPDSHAPEPEQSGAPDLTVLQGGRQDAAPLIRAEIEAALALGASAVHVVTAPDGLAVRARVDGALNEIATVSSLEPESMISALAEVAGLGRTRFTVDGRTVELRPAALPTVLGEHVTFRVVDEGAQAETLDELFASSDAADALRGALERPHGLVLLCAATEAERSAALYATLREAAAPGRSVISVEDPVEQLVPGIDQVEVDPRASVTYATGLHTILRSDADVAAVGELTDHETARLATRGASDRCLVVATIAAKTVSEGVRRLLDLGAEPAILAGALACAVATRPLRTLCTECRTSSYATLEELTLLGRPPEESGRRLVARAAGCEACSGNGYAGRARLTEVLPLGEAVTALLAADATRGEIERAAVDAGMRTVLDAVVEACLEGVTSTDEVARLQASR